MSTVEYRCPICGHRLFNEANSPIKYQCPNVGVEMTNGQVHQEAFVEQTQEYQGPNFLFKDEGEEDPRKTGVLTHGAVNSDGKASVTTVKDPGPPPPMTEEEELEFLRGQWFRLTGHHADRRYKNARLRKDIEDLEIASVPPPEPSEPYDEDMREQIKEEVRSELRSEFDAMKQELLAALRGDTQEEPVEDIQEELEEDQEKEDSNV